MSIEYEDVENPTPWKPRDDMVGPCRHGLAKNGALAEAQPGISERPPRNRSTVLKRVLASAEVKVFIGTNC